MPVKLEASRRSRVASTVLPFMMNFSAKLQIAVSTYDVMRRVSFCVSCLDNTKHSGNIIQTREYTDRNLLNTNEKMDNDNDDDNRLSVVGWWLQRPLLTNTSYL